MRKGESWVSAELRDALEGLSPKQAAGVLRIVQAELAGEGVSSLLDCETQICTSTTYYRKGRGWVHQPGFQRALALARRDYRGWMLEWGGRDALAILAQSAPDAARALRQQVVGDADAIAVLVAELYHANPLVRMDAARALGDTQLLAVVPGLVSALQTERDPEVRQAMVGALGKVAGSRDSDRRQAVSTVLSRVGLEEAATLRVTEAEVDAAIEAEIERLVSEAADESNLTGSGNLSGSG